LLYYLHLIPHFGPSSKVGTPNVQFFVLVVMGILIGPISTPHPPPSQKKTYALA
jgi:hypothetical protein